MWVEIDPLSGFCFGVVRAIDLAEQELQRSGNLLCLGDIVHNGAEVQRLQEGGLETIYYEELDRYPAQRIMFRAHGEPPSTYEKARRLGMEIIDATCPVVLQLQRKVKRSDKSTEIVSEIAKLSVEDLAKAYKIKDEKAVEEFSRWEKINNGNSSKTHKNPLSHRPIETTTENQIPEDRF